MSRIVYHRTRWPLGPSAGLALAAVVVAWGWRATLPVLPAEPAVEPVPAARGLPPAATAGVQGAVRQPAPQAPLAARPAMAPRLPIATAGPAPQVQPQQLTVSRLNAAQAFLNEVHLAPAPRGGFVVQAIEPDSRWERMGLRPGDVVYTLDTPAMAAIDDTSMVALTQQTSIELDVYRGGTLLRLQLSINRDEAPGDDAGRSPS